MTVRLRLLAMASALMLPGAAVSQTVEPAGEAEPLAPPTPSYPADAIRASISGSCTVRFDVDEFGGVLAPKAECTHAAFCAESERAVGKLRYIPLVIDGLPSVRRDVSYPLEYVLSHAPMIVGEEKPCKVDEEALS